MPVTYSPEDNKIRMYVGRVPRPDYEELRRAGFVSTPKQNCDFVATWTPYREDLAREYLEDGEDVEDEDYSPMERAADRAERFSMYRDKRASEAGASADCFEGGPSSFGHQNRARAERHATRHDRRRVYAVSQWQKAEYWQSRTAGVISSALHRAKPATRRARILTLESEQRGHEKSRNEYAETFAAWSAVPTLEGANELIASLRNSNTEGIRADSIKPAGRVAYRLANSYGSAFGYIHPRTQKESSLYSHLLDPIDPLTPAECAALWLKGKLSPDDEKSYMSRWSVHFQLRLKYERMMLEAEGGSAFDVDMEPGGWLGTHQIHSVNRSSVTKRVVSVKVLAPKQFWRGPEPAPLTLQTFNIEKMSSRVYRAPTEEEKREFTEKTKAAKAAEKAGKPKPPPFVNPTEEDAQKLQDSWNAYAASRDGRTTREPSQIWRMTQAEYSQRSKGEYGSCGTIMIGESGLIRMGRHQENRSDVFKIRIGSSGSLYGARRVVVLTDKPQSPIPWAAMDEARALHPNEESMFPKLGEIAKVLNMNWFPDKDQELLKLFEDARYVGWAYMDSMTQFGFTASGREAYAKWNAEVQAGRIVASGITLQAVEG